MSRLYRSSGRRSVRVTIELPVSVVAVLVASARADGDLPETVSVERRLSRLLSLILCQMACMDADYIGDEGRGLRCFGSSGRDYNGVPFPARHYKVLPDVRRGDHLVLLDGLRPWWLKPGRGPKFRG